MAHTLRVATRKGLFALRAGATRRIRFRMIDEQERIRPHMRLFINTSEARELSAAVRDGDTVHLICALSGG